MSKTTQSSFSLNSVLLTELKVKLIQNSDNLRSFFKNKIAEYLDNPIDNLKEIEKKIDEDLVSMNLKKISITLPSDLHNKLKIDLIQKDISIRSFILIIICTELGKI